MLYRLSGTATSRTSYFCICCGMNCITNKYKTEQFIMRLGAQFVIQNSKFLIRTPNVRHNISISNAQYSHLSAQQNLWCEIFEF